MFCVLPPYAVGFPCEQKGDDAFPRSFSSGIPLVASSPASHRAGGGKGELGVCRLLKSILI